MSKKKSKRKSTGIRAQERKQRRVVANVSAIDDADSKEILFSFKYLDPDHPRFLLSNVTQQFFISCFNKLRVVSEYNWNELNGKGIMKRITLTYSAEKKYGFHKIPIEHDRYNGYEFKITKKGRIHGIRIDSCFYVIWIDPNHDLFS